MRVVDEWAVLLMSGRVVDEWAVLLMKEPCL